MKRIRRTKITVEQCRLIVRRPKTSNSETIACPDCGRVFNPGDLLGEIAECKPIGLLTEGSDPEASPAE